MRILIDTLSVLPGVSGGGETYIQGLVNTLSEVDRESTYLVLVTPVNQHLFVSPAENFCFLAARIDNRSRLIRILYEQLRLPLLARRWKADLVLFPANMISLLLPWFGIPSVVILHDASPFFYGKNFPTYVSTWQVRFLKELAQYAAHHSVAVITISEFSRQEVCAYTGVPAQKVFVVPPGCPRATVRNGDVASLAHGYGVVKPYVLTVGRSNKHKNLDSFVLAFAQAKRRFHFPHDLVIAGTQGSGHRDLLSAIAAASAGEFVHMTGYVEPPDLPLLYQTADLFAMPSLYEGFGFPVLEAMQLGVPTLVSTAASLREVAGEASVYANPCDIDSMAAALGRVLTDANLRRQLAEKGRVQAAKFSWRNTALETLKVCRMAASRRERK